MAVSASTHQRGTSPITTVSSNPLKVTNSREIQAQIQQQLQSMQMFPGEHAEPPPPYPMGTAAAGTTSNPPPSYSQSMSLRQSPTLSSTSSDYRYTEFRRSPAPNAAAVVAANQLIFHHGHHLNGHNAPSPSPSASSMMSASSRTSSTLQAWSSRQAKTQSPVIVQSVKSTQVQKPVLQTATAPDIAISKAAGGAVAAPVGAPPSYEMSIQQQLNKQTPSPSPVIVNQQQQLAANSPLTVPRTMSPIVIPEKEPQVQQPQAVLNGAAGPLPPPPPYPSTKVHQQQLVNLSKQPQPVISTAKVVPSNKPLLQRKYSPMNASETASSSASRSESPISDSQQTISSENTVSCSPSSFNDPISADSGLPESALSSLMPPPPPPPYKSQPGGGPPTPGKEKTTHISSPKPERRHISPAKEEARKSYIKNCPPEAYKFFMEQHVERIWKEYYDRLKRQQKLEMALQEIKDRPDQGMYAPDDFRHSFKQLESNYLRTKRAKLNKYDFRMIKRIGAGAFGEVSLVRKKNSQNDSANANHDEEKQKFAGLYAMKTLKKNVVVQRSQVAHVIAEKDILSEANNDWIVKLHYSFQVKSIFSKSLKLR